MATWTTAYINSLPDSSFLHIESGGSKDGDGKTTPRSLRHFPVKDASGKVDLPHVRNALARIPQSNLSAAAKQTATNKAEAMLKSAGTSGRSEERQELVRALPGGYLLRDDGGPLPVLVGELAVFNEWAEIRSRREGHFLERIAPGAFSKTIAENRDRMRCLFQHGLDPSVGEKPLGPIRSLDADGDGLSYVVDLLDTSYNADIVEMLRADPPVLGSSFRFEVIQDEVDERPKRSSYNPRGLPEVTRTEVRMKEFGPVTFPAYLGATAGLRSLTDRIIYHDELPEDLERLDQWDVGILTSMIQMGGSYIADQDEADEAANITKMKAVLTTLNELVAYEIDEEEPAEPDDVMNSNDDAPAGDAAAEGTAPDERAATTGLLTAPLVGVSRRRRGRGTIATLKEERPSWQL